MKPSFRNPLLRNFVLAAITTALATPSAYAAIYQWNGSTSSDWATDTNWTGTPPADADVVGAHRLNVNGATALTYSADQGTSVFANVGDRGLVIGSGSSGTMNITGGSFSTLGSVAQDIIGNGNGNTGVLNISAGAFIGTNVGTSLGNGGGTGRVSTLTLSGSGSATVSNLLFNGTTANINLNGGTLEANSIVNTYIESAARIRFNGGTLKARQSTATFISSASLLQALVQSGGAVIDTNTFDITIAEPLLEDASSLGGGLTKNSAGLLTLTATSTLTGPVDVNAGGLGVRGGTASWAPSSFTHSGNILNFDIGVFNSNPVAINTGALTVDSAITVNVTGSNFQVGEIPLIQYTSKNFTGGSLTLGTLPPNIVATLVDDNAGLIYLNVTAAPTTYVWSGDTTTPGTGIWNTTSLTWNSFTDAFSTSGTQIVQFPDLTGGGTVTITGDNSPINFAINNVSGNPYSFEGTGKITGATGITKTGTGKAIFNGAAHDFSGNTTISAGAIIKQAADATTGAITVSNNATFALDGGITTGTGQTAILNGPGATGGNYFYTGSAVQRGALQGQNGDNTWNGNVVVTSTSNTRIGVQDGASLTIGGNITESVAGVSPTLRAGNLGDDITLNGVCSWTGDTFMFSSGASIKIGGDDRLPIGTRIVFTGSDTILDLNGHNQQLRGMTSFNPTVTNNGATPSVLTLNPDVTENIIYYGVIVDGTETISLVNSGDGITTLTGTNTYTGDTTVTGGILRINGNQIDATGAVQVNSGTLAGTGTVGGAVTVESTGTLAPGVTLGVLTVDSADLSAGGTLAIELDDSTTPKTDLLNVSNDLNVTGAKLDLIVTGALAEASYVIATASTITGTIAPGDVTGLPAGYTLVQTATEIRLDQAAGADYDAWLALYPSITDPNDKLSTADPDNDGLTNQEEFAFGLAPDSGSSVNPILVQLGKTAGTFTYQRRSSTGLTYTIWTSPDLDIWTEDTTAVQTPGTPDGDNVQSVAVTLTGAPLTADKLFVRVKASD